MHSSLLGWSYAHNLRCAKSNIGGRSVTWVALATAAVDRIDSAQPTTCTPPSRAHIAAPFTCVEYGTPNKSTDRHARSRS